MGGTGVATLVKSSVLSASAQAQHKPLGLGSSALPGPHGVVPRPTRQLRRQWTTAKPGRGERGADVSCNVLPFFLDLSLAFAPGMEFFDAVKSSVDSEVVFQATLQVPAHHALACRMSAYGTPFAAPDLQAAAHELGDQDMEFAACLASPPDLDEQLSVNFGRVMSLLERNQQQPAAGAIATRGAGVRAHAASASPVQQALRSTPGSAQHQAPKVLVSVDEAESGAAQLQRQSSAKKQPKSIVQDYGKRAMQALLGLGYLLTVLHERSLGGKIEFTAGLSAGTIMSPQPSGSHTRRRTSGSGGALGMPSMMLAGLRQMIECPSLLPRSSSLGRRPGAAAEGPTSPPSRGHMPSFEAAWEHVHPSATPGGSSVGAGRAAAAAGGGSPGCHSLQLQLSLSAPLRSSRSCSIDGSASPASVTPVGTPAATSRLAQMSPGQRGGDAVAFVGSPLGLATPAGTALPPRQEPAQAAGLHHVVNLGLSSSDQAAFDAAVAQAQTQAVPPQQQQERSVFASAAAAAALAASEERAASLPAGAAPASPAAAASHHQQQQQRQQQLASPQVASFYLSDQGAVTSPMPRVSNVAGAAPAPAPFGSPCPTGTGGSSGGGGSTAGGSMPDTPRRLIMPVMSMRLTCQPAWQYDGATRTSVSDDGGRGRNSSSGGCDQGAAGAGVQQQQQAAPAVNAASMAGKPPPAKPAQHKQGVHMHAFSHQERQQLQQGAADGRPLSPVPFSSPPQGLWPTMSFSLVPVRLPANNRPSEPGSTGFRAAQGTAPWGVA